ncbi:substrate-binding periplasmic protein [Vibrio quintilis]|uniref:Bacterial extracellular solute-binding proteins, family 3 n=1 Tax=Vibrio quintilis TaxID=1117707 RepID=A0A1M7Z203_9VIBR|nr:transporter substrate-binding domain-containing protein [Vibrio quintilis]SHO58999.1 Bacterial extracellular solute-binding proteins, family 3 [Vibrio quintilis]
MNIKISMMMLLFSQLLFSSHLWAATVTVYSLEAMPYCGLINGHPSGIAIDILNEATKYGAPAFQFRFDIPWMRATQRVQYAKDELVAIIPFTRSAVREHQFKWVAEIMATEYRFYSYHRTVPVQSVGEIKHKTVGVVHGHAIIPMLANLGLRLDTGAKTAQKNILKMISKRFDVIADSDVIVMYNWKQAGLKMEELQVGPAIGQIKRVYIATGLDFPDDVAAKISEAVAIMKQNGELQKIYDRWL